MNKRKMFPVHALAVSTLLGAALFCSVPVLAEESVSADTAIVGVKSYGFVDSEGAKTSAIIVEYNTEIDADSVSLEDYEIIDYAIWLENENGYESTVELDGDDIVGNEGQAEKVYVNDEPATSEDGGTDTGNYVIIEVNTDFMLSSSNLVYTTSMMAGVTQTGEVTSGDVVITAGTEEISNYITYEEQSSYNADMMVTVIETDTDAILIPTFGEGSGWTLNYIGDGAFQATDCYSEYTGEYYDFELPYSIYVPDEETMEANKGNICLVVHMEHAGANNTDPMAALTSSLAATLLSSDVVQAENPSIVIIPQIEESRRTTDDLVASSEAQPAAWELIDYILEEYADYIDTNRIYGTGQSMGGMALLYMASQRDNFFAGLAVVGSQWSNNYDKDYQHDGAAARSPENDPVSFNGFGLDEENYQNWYYMVSDDNILVHTCLGDAMANGEWSALAEYFAAAGVEIAYAEWDPFLDLEEQNELDRELTTHDNTTPGSGINWGVFTSGSHMSTWKYGYRITSPLEWLFEQTRESENERGKIEQLANDWLGRDEDGNILEGSGTNGLNSAQYGISGPVEIYVEGWTPESAAAALEEAETDTE